MSILVFIEGSDGELKKSSKEAVSYAYQSGKLMQDDNIIAAVIGNYEDTILSDLGKYGASKVIAVVTTDGADKKIGACADILSDMIKSQDAQMLILTKSAFSDNVGGRVAGKTGASILSNVVSLPEVSSGFKIKKSIFTGKAFAFVALPEGIKIIIAKKNIVEIQEVDKEAIIERIESDTEGKEYEKITGRKIAEGDVLLEEADIVVSAGRGLKGPENWAMIEELAKALGAATACSKPVSDMGWRPHHEHVGQTGVKVSPNLYIAVGISGAIQHLAGVNASKVMVAINIDPEAPFFKAADYGIVGDAFNIVPKLTAKVKSL